MADKHLTRTERVTIDALGGCGNCPAGARLDEFPDHGSTVVLGAVSVPCSSLIRGARDSTCEETVAAWPGTGSALQLSFIRPKWSAIARNRPALPSTMRR